MKLHTEEVAYQARGATLRGFVAWDSDKKEKRPGVLVVHEWWGHDEQARSHARQLAEAGYVGFAVDMYGDGKKAETPDQAGKLMMAVLNDAASLRARFEAARDALVEQPVSDRARLAAVGYCFGGVVVLEMARAGLDLKAVAAFHPGGLATKTPAKRGVLKAKVLVALGADDPFVKQADRDAFKKEMTAAGADLEWVEYPGAVHGFTVPAATERGKKYGLPLAYDAKADNDASARLSELLIRTFSHA